jgi:hypothetical protein
MARFLTGAVTYSPRATPKEQQLLGLRDRIARLDVLMEQGIAPETADMMMRHWETKGAAFGHPWADWKPSTLRARIRKGNVADGILWDEGDLHDSLFESIRSARRLTRVRTGLRLSLVPDDAEQRRKFGFHMRGVKRGGRIVMPIRQPVPSPLPRSFRDRVRAITRDFMLTGRIRGARGQFVAASAS